MGDWLLDGRLHEIQVPVDLVWGEADQLMTLAYAGRMLEGLQRARLYPVSACGHVPQRECPLRFVEALRKALAEPYEEVDEPQAEALVQETSEGSAQQGAAS
jgi:pimeloyl-ACP methyl ester carboxylesterase